jgi:hypothetical protein
LANIQIAGVNIRWYLYRKGKTNIKIRRTLQSRRDSDEPPLPLSTVLVNGVTYYATQTINGVESEAIPITVRIINGFRTYPNPIKDVFVIENTSKIDSIRLLSTAGQEILSQNPSASLVNLDLSKIKSGLYFMNIVTEGKIKTVKVIKE